MPKGIPNNPALQVCPKCKGEYRCNVGAFQSHLRWCGEDPAVRFWAKINKTEGCWLWTGCVNTTGYGMASWSGRQKNIVAHRRVWTMLKGPIPEGMEVCHTCDVPRCCNPDHLFLGTHAENMKDCAAKGRYHASLTPDQVREVRRLLPTMQQKQIADQLGVGYSTINGISTGKAYRHIK